MYIKSAEPKLPRHAQVERTYTGPQTGDIVDHMKACNPRGPLVIHIAKLFPKTDVSAFDALGRILSGTVKPGDRVRVLGEAYTPEDEEDSAVAEVTKVWVYQARYRIPLTKALAGALPLPSPPVHLWDICPCCRSAPVALLLYQEAGMH